MPYKNTCCRFDYNLSDIFMLYCIYVDVFILHIVITPFIISFTCLFDMLFSHTTVRYMCCFAIKKNKKRMGKKKIT